ncbi:hypothetical protein EQG41_04530 [Billgrantia azerbaijanica]|nr:hypothetical protein EQG41_04530 [Halomonas azerbaijanica]
MQSKRYLLEHLRNTVPAGVRWALRGGRCGLSAWLAADTVKDLDVWVHGQDIGAFIQALAPDTVGAVSLESDPRWLQHIVLVMAERFGGQLVDVAYGDLKVGGALTCREVQITTRIGPHGPMLAGVAAVADLLMRKLLRGKAVSPSRHAEAELHWHTAPVLQRKAWLGDLRATFGDGLPGRVQAILAGRRITGRERAAFVLAAARASLQHSGLPLMLRRRRRLVLGRRQRTLLKRPMAPVLFLVSDERGADRVESTLAEMGVATHRVMPGATAGLVSWRGVVRFVKAWMYGNALIRCGNVVSGSPVLAPLWGDPVRLDAADTRADILRSYYLAAHRWYIDDPAMARQVTGSDTVTTEPMAVRGAHLQGQQPFS